MSVNKRLFLYQRALLLTHVKFSRHHELLWREKKNYKLQDVVASGEPPLLSNVGENEGECALGEAVPGGSFPCSTQHSKYRGPA